MILSYKYERIKATREKENTKKLKEKRIVVVYPVQHQQHFYLYWNNL
jgi:hypothetical protein